MNSAIIMCLIDATLHYRILHNISNKSFTKELFIKKYFLHLIFSLHDLIFSFFFEIVVHVIWSSLMMKIKINASVIWSEGYTTIFKEA